MRAMPFFLGTVALFQDRDYRPYWVMFGGRATLRTVTRMHVA